MSKKLLLSAVIFFLTSVSAIFILWSGRSPAEGASVPPAPAGQMVLYYGSTCPHCKDLEAWMETNGIPNKFSYQSKEVYGNKENAAELVSTAKVCKINDERLIGIPFLWTGSECLIGTPEIQSFFEKALDILELQPQN